MFVPAHDSPVVEVHRRFPVMPDGIAAPIRHSLRVEHFAHGRAFPEGRSFDVGGRRDTRIADGTRGGCFRLTRPGDIEKRGEHGAADHPAAALFPATVDSLHAAPVFLADAAAQRGSGRGHGERQRQVAVPAKMSLKFVISLTYGHELFRVSRFRVGMITLCKPAVLTPQHCFVSVGRKIENSVELAEVCLVHVHAQLTDDRGLKPVIGKRLL